MSTSTVTFDNIQRARVNSNFQFQNITEVITAELEIIQLENGISYGLDNIRIWNPTIQKFEQFTDETCKIEAKDFDSAKAIFWPRFHYFVRRKTSKRIPIEITRIHRLDARNNTVPEQPDQVIAASRKTPRLTKKELELAQTP